MTVKQIFNTSAELDYPTVLPTLDLDFANSKTLDPRITFTRASGGSYVGADGLIKYAGVNEARFDHDPETGESLGLLIEEARTNVVLRSETFDDNTLGSFGSWGRPGNGVTVTPNAIMAPDGTMTADFVDNVGQIVSLVEQAITVTPSSTTDYYATIYAKKGTSNGFTFNCYYNGNTEDNVNFNFVTGNVTSVPNPGEFIFQDVGNGWYRCGFRISRDSTGSRSTLLFRMWPSIRNQLSGGTYFWGAQLEQGSFPTSYIPTQESTRTRAVDNASITGKNFSSFYSEGGYGSVYCNFRTFSREYSNQTPFRIHYGVNLRGIGINVDTRSGTNKPGFATRTDDGSSGVNNDDVTYGLNTNFKVAGAYGINEIAAAFNGNIKTFPQSFIFTPMTRMDIATRIPVAGSLNFYNGHISRLTYFPKRLPNSQLQALTS